MKFAFKTMNELTGVTVLRGMPASQTEANGDLPVHSMASLRHGERVSRYSRSADLGRWKDLKVRPGDLLVGIGGTELGECYVVRDDDAPFVPGQQVAIIRLGEPPAVDPWFLAAWFDSRQGRHQVDGLIRSTVVPRVSIEDLSKVSIPVPDAGSQDGVAQRYRAFEDVIHAHRAVVRGTQQLKEVELTLAFSDTGD